MFTIHRAINVMLELAVNATLKQVELSLNACERAVVDCRNLNICRLSVCIIKLKYFPRFSKLYLFSVSVSASVLLLLTTVGRVFSFRIFRQRELLQLMLMNYVESTARIRMICNM